MSVNLNALHPEAREFCASAKAHIDAALEAMARGEALEARAALRDAREQLGRVDTRLSSHSAPPA